MTEPVDLAAWKAEVGDRPLRELVAHHLSKQDARTRAVAYEGTLGLLPPAVRGATADMAAAFSLIAHTPQFWDAATCGSFLDTVQRAMEPKIASAGLVPTDKELWNVFQVFLLRVVDTVATQDAARRASGISRPFPWASAILMNVPIFAYLRMRDRVGDGAEAFGYALSNLGYVLLVAGVVAGSFRILGLRSRRIVLAAAVATWVAGVVLVNLR